MNEENKEIIDQTKLAEDVANKIPYEFSDYYLVKPLDPIKVKKEFSKPIPKGEPTKDENGIEAQDFDKVETEVKEVDSNFRRGIVLKQPMYVKTLEDKTTIYNIGDIIVFRDTAGIDFDLLKGSKLLRQFDIFGILRNDRDRASD
jgi:hypothetical protein